MTINKIFLIFFSFTLFACSGAKESIMPFRNLGNFGESLFPVKNSDPQKIFRIWINNSTSIDRILTISQDTLFGNHANLVEIGSLSKGKREKDFYKKIEIVPKNGFENFFKKLDSLNLMSQQNRENFSNALHKPFSLYVVEYKNGESYNQFSFQTNYPNKSDEKNNYKSIENLIFKEFIWAFYMK